MSDFASARRRLVAAVLSQAPGDAAVTAATVHAALATFSAELAVLVGRQAARALFVRSLYLASKNHSCLALITEDTVETSFEDLRSKLGEQSADEAHAAGVRLLTEFTDLLATLVGESLTDRLLQKAWNQPNVDRKAGAHA